MHSLGWDILACNTMIYYLGWPHCHLTVFTDLRKTNENISSLKYYCMSWHIRWPFSLKIAFKDGIDLYTKGNEKSPILGLRAKTGGLADFPPVIGGNSRRSYCLLRESQVVCVCVFSHPGKNCEPRNWHGCYAKISNKTLRFDSIFCMYVDSNFSTFFYTPSF